MGRLQVGVGREIITPQVGGQLYGHSPDIFSDCVSDDLTATAFYFEQDGVRALMVSLTVCSVQTKLADEISAKIEEAFGIPKDNIMLSAIHTHSGPNTTGGTGWGEIDTAYCEEIFVPRILLAVEKASANCEPVSVGTAAGDSLVGINRRELNEENEIRFGQNVWGSFNPRMTVISFKNDKGVIIGNMIHYGAHCTAAGRSRDISRDWAGRMIDAVEEQSGAISAFFNGAEGDVGPRISNGRTTGNMEYVAELGAVAAQDAVKIYHDIFDYHEIDLRVSKKDLRIPLQKRPTLEEAEEEVRTLEGGVNIYGLRKAHFEDVVASYAKGYEEKEYAYLPQTVIVLGNIVFVAFQHEIFSEIALRIDKYVEGASVLSLSNTNGSEGYFVSEDAICRGGYEVGMFFYTHLQPYANDADAHLIKETVAHIREVKER